MTWLLQSTTKKKNFQGSKKHAFKISNSPYSHIYEIHLSEKIIPKTFEVNISSPSRRRKLRASYFDSWQTIYKLDTHAACTPNKRSIFHCHKVSEDFQIPLRLSESVKSDLWTLELFSIHYCHAFVTVTHCSFACRENIL